jgi:ATP-binding cassette subfamily B protein
MPNLNILRESCELGKDGVNLLGIASAAESVGLRTLSVEISFEKLIKEAPLPCIIHWNQNHFVVVTPNSSLKKIEVADPARSIIYSPISQPNAMRGLIGYLTCVCGMFYL